jgi:crotonobetaine/carnitine-CoA ligase
MSSTGPAFVSHGRLLEEKAALSPDQTFLIFDDQRFTLGQLNAWSNRIAHGLLSMRIGPGSHVSVMLPNSPRWLAVYFALQKIGAGIVPINVSLRGEGLAYILDHSDSRALVIDPAHAPDLDEIRERIPKVHRIIFDTADVPDFPLPVGAIRLADLEASRDDDPLLAIDGDAVCALMYTSGTTGLPKGVVMRYANADASRTEPLAQLFYKPEDTLYTCLPLFHANALFLSTMCALHAGARLALGRRFSASRFWDETRRYGATTFNALGAMIPILMKQPPRADDAENPVRFVLSAACPANVWEAFENRFGVKIIECYGAVDGAGFLTFNFGNAPVGSIGQPPPGVEARIVDPNGLEVEIGTPGELTFRIDDPQERRVEYYKNPEASGAKVRAGWLHTGDIVYRDTDGNLYFVDRLNDCMRRRGENVSSYEVEREINAHPAVLESAVFGVPSELGEDDIMAVVVPRPGATLRPEALISFLEGRMAGFMIPRYVDLRAEIPKTETHRVQKTQLKRSGVTATTWDRERAPSQARTA